MQVASIRSKVQGLLLVFTIIILALSGHINVFQGFFYAADRFPFVMSIVTLLTLIVVITCGLASSGRTRLARPSIELVWLAILSLAWLITNSFSTHRWQFIQMDDCKNIPIDPSQDFLGQAKTWCLEIQALRAFVWIEWVIFVVYFGTLLFWAIGHARRGATHVWSTSINQFDPLGNGRKRGMSTAHSFYDSAMPQNSQQFDYAPQMEQHIPPHITVDKPGDGDRGSWVSQDQFHQYQEPERQAYPHYQTQAPQHWDQFGGHEHAR